MKNFLYIISLCVIAFISINTYANKVAIINVNQVFQEIATKKAVTEQLEKEFKVRANELKNMEQDLQNKAKKLQKNITKSNERDLQAFENQRAGFLQKAQKFEQDNQRRQQEERNKILQTIKTATKAIAEKEHFDIVVDKNTILYPENYSGLKNITDLVIKKVK